MDGLYGKSYILRWFGGTPIFGNIHMMHFTHMNSLTYVNSCCYQSYEVTVAHEGGLDGFVPICPSRIGAVEKQPYLTNSMMLGLEKANPFGGLKPQKLRTNRFQFFF